MTSKEEPRTFEPELAAQALRAKGYERVEVGPSNVTYSRYDYVFVYLTDAKAEGPHVIVSDRLEAERTRGYLVGGYRNQDDVEGVESHPTWDEALAAVRRIASYLRDEIASETAVSETSSEICYGALEDQYARIAEGVRRYAETWTEGIYRLFEPGNVSEDERRQLMSFAAAAALERLAREDWSA